MLSFRIVCKTNPVAVNSFEEALFPIFQLILSQDVQGKLKNTFLFYMESEMCL